MSVTQAAPAPNAIELAPPGTSMRFTAASAKAPPGDKSAYSATTVLNGSIRVENMDDRFDLFDDRLHVDTGALLERFGISRAGHLGRRRLIAKNLPHALEPVVVGDETPHHRRRRLLRVRH